MKPVTENSALVTVTPLTVRVEPESPVFLMVTVCDGLVVPTSTEPKLSEAGVTVILGEHADHATGE